MTPLYSLVGQDAKKQVSVAGGKVSLTHTPADATASPPDVESLTSLVTGLDYETATSFTVSIASD